MTYKLVCSDIDGTLLNKNRELSESTISEVQRILPIPFVLISSRMPAAITHLQQQFNNTTSPLIAYNGALVLVNNKVIQSVEICNKVLSAILNACEKTTIHLSLYHSNEWYVPSMDYWAKREASNTKVKPVVKSNVEVLSSWELEKKGAHKIMCMGDKLEIDVLFNYLEAEFADEIILYRSKDTYIEISHRSISKKTAIELLLVKQYPTIKMEDVLAFGDNYNDIEMLKTVGLGVAVANANKEVLKIADRITESNKKDGVSKILRELF